MTITGLICAWKDPRPTAAQYVFLVGAGIALGYGLTTFELL